MPATRSILRHLRSWGDLANQSDTELLALYCRSRDESAFATIVERHGPMVFGVARRLLRSNHAAEDVFQATFLVLARQARAVRRPEALASWLHGVALRVARKACARAERDRRPDVRPVPAPARDPVDELSWREMQQVLDEEMRRLPERYRLPLLLCYLEGRTRDEAAGQLGWSAQQVKGRLERARERLRLRLVRRGVALSAALAASLLTERTRAAVPRLLLVSLVPSAIKYGMQQTGDVASPVAVAAADGVIRTMYAPIWKAAAIVLLLTGLSALGAGALLGRPNQPPASQPVPAPKADEPPPVKAEVPAKPNSPNEQFGPVHQELRAGPRMTMAGAGAGRLVFSTDGKTLLSSAKYPGKVQSWDTTSGRELPLTQQNTDVRYELLGFNPQGDSIGYQILYKPPTANTNSGLLLVNLRSGQPFGAVEFSDADPKVRRYRHVVLSPDQATLAITEWPDKVLLFDVKSAKRLGQLAGGEERPATALAFSPDGRLLSVAFSANEPSPGRKQNEVMVWDWARQERLWSASTKTHSASVAFSADGRQLAAGQELNDLPIWDAKTGKENAKLQAKPESKRLAQIAFSPDGLSLAASWQDDRQTGVVLWDAKNWQEQLVSMRGKENVWALAFSPDSRRLAIADMSKTLYVEERVLLRFRIR
jgi:RNA polymerase sigma factor (sigma-70 family)